MPFDRAHPDEYFAWSDEGPSLNAEMAGMRSFFQIFSSTLKIFDPKIEICHEDLFCPIFDADSESEVQIGQFGREGQKQRSFDPKNMVFYRLEFHLNYSEENVQNVTEINQ